MNKIEYQTYGYIVIDKYKDPWTTDSKHKSSFTNRIHNCKIFTDKWRAEKVAYDTGASVIPVRVNIEEDHTMEAWVEDSMRLIDEI